MPQTLKEVDVVVIGVGFAGYQCSNSGEMGARHLILLRELQQSGKSFVSLAS